jgi:cytochrome P450
MCIGWKLAMMEATVLLARIMRAFAIAPIAGAPPPKPKVRITMRPDDGMKLSLVPRR